MNTAARKISQKQSSLVKLAKKGITTAKPSQTLKGIAKFSKPAKGGKKTNGKVNRRLTRKKNRRSYF